MRGRRGPGGRLVAVSKLQRLAASIVVLLGLAGLAIAVAATQEVDDEGNALTEGGDPADVEITGDDDLVAQQPPGASSDGPGEAEIVEQTYPAEDAQILQQQQIGIDLGDQYRVTRLFVAGTLIAEEHLIRRDALNQVFFQPGDDLEFDAFPAGRVCASAEVERLLTGEVVRQVEWCFEVT
jgi:hypothetical protein